MPERFALQHAGPEQESSRGRPRQTLQRRVQNALRWRSWGGESDTPGSNNAQNSSSGLGSRPPSGPGRHRTGRSAGSDVELSALPSTTASSISSEIAVLGSPAATVGSGEQLARSTFGSNKSSTSSAAGAGPPTDAGASCAGAGSSTAAGMQQQQQQNHQQAVQQQPAPAIGIPGAADDAFSIVTQAGSTAHSFTSLYSILADQGEAGSEAAGPSTAAAAGLAGSSISHMGGAMSPFRGSDAGGDVGNSVSTLPLISEAAYDDEQQLMQEVDELAGGEGVSGRVSGFDEAEEDQIDDGFAAQTRAAAQGALVMSGISGRPRVSSSHGSITSAASDASLSAPGSVASGATGAAIGARMPSPAGASSGFGRPVYGSQRSSGSRHSLHQQQQQQQQAGSDSRISTDLPPFGSRKRPDDDTCSYATQAGSVHSVSSILSSTFAESAPQQRTSGSGAAAAAAGQQLLIHPLSEPTDELACFEEEDGSLTAAAGLGSSAADGSINAHHHSLSSPGSSSSQQRERLGHRASNSWDMEQQQQWQQQQQQQQGSPSPGAAAARAHSGGVERKGSIKGALRSVVAWGSGLGQRLQRSTIEKPAGHKQQQQGAGRAIGASGSRGEAAPTAAGVRVEQQRAAGAVGGVQELASM